MEPISLHYHLNQFFNRFSHYPCIIIILSLFQSNCEYLTDTANIIIHNILNKVQLKRSDNPFPIGWLELYLIDLYQLTYIILHDFTQNVCP